MVEPRELEKLGENISKDYIQKRISLNVGLKKVASERGLNKQELRRVAESANVATYLALIKTAEDKYLKFDLADASLAHEEIVKEGKEDIPMQDYSLENAELDVTDIFELYKKAEVPLYSEKEIQNIIEHRNSIKTQNGDFTKKSEYLQGVVEYLNDNFISTQGLFTSNVETLETLIKQAVLEGTTYSDISNIIKTASECTGEAMIELFKTRLSNRINHIDFDKQAEFSSSLPNTESRLFKLASEIEDTFLHALRLEEAYKAYESEYSNLRKANSAPNMIKNAGFFNTASDTFRWFREHPKTTAAVAMLASYKAGKAVAQKKQETKVPLTREAVNLRLKQYKVR